MSKEEIIGKLTDNSKLSAAKKINACIVLNAANRIFVNQNICESPGAWPFQYARRTCTINKQNINKWSDLSIRRRDLPPYCEIQRAKFHAERKISCWSAPALNANAQFEKVFPNDKSHTDRTERVHRAPSQHQSHPPTDWICECSCGGAEWCESGSQSPSPIVVPPNEIIAIIMRSRCSHTRSGYATRHCWERVFFVVVGPPSPSHAALIAIISALAIFSFCRCRWTAAAERMKLTRVRCNYDGAWEACRCLKYRPE